MANVLSEAMPWHSGEKHMHSITKVPTKENPNSPFLQPRAASMLQRFPLLAVGTVDDDERPWATIWGGEAPFAQQIGDSVIGVRTTVDASFDPVVQALYHGKRNGEVIQEPEGKGRMVSGLSIHLEQRNRMKLFGRMMAGALQSHEETEGKAVGQIQLVVKIEQSLGNCPKYLNCKRIRPALPAPKLISEGLTLSQEGLDLLAKADTMFVASADRDNDMDMNHRGGPAGFIRVASNTPIGAVLVWPEYSGNNFYQTLGNLSTNPRAGIVVPDFATGSVLYITGTTEILFGASASALLPRSTLVVRLTITSSRFVASGLPFRGEALEPSPYNPSVRYLRSEKPPAVPEDSKAVTAKLIANDKLTPSIYRVRFAISDPAVFGPWKAGQYAALSFHDELYVGYSHMRDDDPRSLNDDFLRTFTVSSPPGSLGLHGEEFEMTIRNVGSVTGFLGRQTPRHHLEVPLKGSGGDFRIEQKEGGGLTPFVAGGIGITPLLAQVSELDLRRLRLFWTLSMRDVGLVHDTFKKSPSLAGSTSLFLTGTDADVVEGDREKLEEVFKAGAKVQRRRLQAEDLMPLKDVVEEWYVCCAPKLRTSILEWLPGKKAVYENFDY